MIDFKNVRFTYDGETFVLDGINLHVHAGEYVCILGSNGSGKSTLAKHINALLLPDEGSVQVLGYSTQDPANTYLIRSNAGMVFQNPDDQIVASLIENDVAFGPENLGVEPGELRRRVTAALEQVGLQGFEEKETAALSGGQKQRVAIAGALAMQPKILVLDEATAMLDPRGRAGLLRVCRELNAAGMTIVAITHFMEEAAAADRVFVLDKGKVAFEGSPEEVLTQAAKLEGLSLDVPFATKMSLALQQRGLPVQTAIYEGALEESICQVVGKQKPANTQDATLASSFSGSSSATLFGTAIDSANVHIVLDQVSYSYDPAAAKDETPTSAGGADWGNNPENLWALQNISLGIAKGSITGIAGHTGSGKSTLIQHMNGLLQPTKGRVLVDGVDIANKEAAHMARQSVGLVFQYPEHQLFASSVYKDVAFGPRNMGLDEGEVQRRVEHAMRLVELDFHQLKDRSPFELSGGQQRRVAFAGVLAMEPSTLILDEPVAGLDPKAREEFLQLIQQLHAQQGLTVVLVSHSMEDLARLCDWVVLMNQGAIFAQGTPAEVFVEEGALKNIGLGLPAPQRLAQALRARGILPATNPAEVASIESLTASLATIYGGRAGA